MVTVLDEEGNLFGVVNIVDALAVLLFVLVLLAGASVILGERSTPSATPNGTAPTTNGTAPADLNETAITIQFRSEMLEPFVADAIAEGPVPTENISRIHRKSVSPSQVIVQSRSGNLSVQPHPTLKTVTLSVTLTVTVRDGEYVYQERPVEIGTELTLDFGRTSVSGSVTGIEASASR